MGNPPAGIANATEFERAVQVSSEPQTRMPGTVATLARDPGGDTPPPEWDAQIDAIGALNNSDPVAGGQQAAAALPQARAQRRGDLESRLTYILGFSHLARNNPVEATACMLRAAELARGADRPDLEVTALSGLGAAHVLMGDSSAAIACYERALGLQHQLPTSSGRDTETGRLLNNFGFAFFRMSLPDRAAPLFRQARDLFLRTGDALDAALALGNCAAAEAYRAEQLDRQQNNADRARAQQAAVLARELATQAIADAESLRAPRIAIFARLSAASASATLGDCAAAADQLSRVGAVLADETWRPYYKLQYRALTARVLRLTGRPHEAIAELRAELASYGEPVGQASCRLAEADRAVLLEELVAAQEAAGDLAGALHSLRQLHELSLRIRDERAELRGQALSAQLEVERAQHRAEVERLRAEQLALRNEELARQVHIDALTGLPNRRVLDAALAHRTEKPRSQFACVLADIDHFKAINDRLSHLVGDEVLRRVGELMRRAVRDGDLAARYGGEEFALLLDRVDAERARQISERLRAVIAGQPWHALVSNLPVTISLGVALRRPGENAEQLLARTDRCLYAAKQLGRNRVVLDAGEAIEADDA